MFSKLQILSDQDSKLYKTQVVRRKSYQPALRSNFLSSNRDRAGTLSACLIKGAAEFVDTMEDKKRKAPKLHVRLVAMDVQLKSKAKAYILNKYNIRNRSNVYY